MQHRSKRIAPALVVALLAACGGGGGSDSPAPSTTANVSLSGTAAKGLMVGADVVALAVNADGSIGSTPLASTTTDANGLYTLKFDATKDRPYVIKVSAKADGSTTHLDEVSGVAQALPGGFSMRALFIPTTTGAVTTSASITPFSELAVAAAAKASGGVTAANANQAVSTFTQLLGFDPSSATAKSTATATSADEKKLAVLLAAVSKLASGGALGCSTGAPGEVTQCVVNKLSDAASASTLKLSSGSTDVSAALKTAVTDVLADKGLNGGIDPSTLSAITNNLACTGSCTAAPPATASAIDSARNLFTQIKTDWQTLFSRGGATSIATGAANAEGWKFRQAMSSVQVPAANLVEDLGALLMGIELYNDYKAGRTASPSRGRAPGLVASGTPGAIANYNTVGCTLYQEIATTNEATSPANALFIGCRASYFTNIVGGGATTVTTDWRHGFTITPPTAGASGDFSYTTRTRKRVTTCTAGVVPCPFTNDALQTNFYSGKVNASTDAAGAMTGFTATGDLAATFAQDGITLVNDHTNWNITGTRTIVGNHLESSALSGSMVAYDALGTVLGTLTVKDGKSSEIPVSRDAAFNEVKPGSPTAKADAGGSPDSASLDLVWATPTAEFEGVFSVEPTVWDTSGTDRLPTAVNFSGALRNIAGGITTEFFKGTFTATATGFASYNAMLPKSTSNFFSTAFTASGTLTAPNRPTLEVTASAGKKSYEPDVTAVTMQYRSLVAGQARVVVAIDVSRDATGNEDFKLSEATSGLSMSWAHKATSANLLKGSEVIGVVTRSDKLLTFSNGTVVSLEIGL